MNMDEKQRQKKLADKGGKKAEPYIGLVWSENSQHLNVKNRSIPISKFISLIKEEFNYVSLQKELSKN